MGTSFQADLHQIKAGKMHDAAQELSDLHDRACTLRNDLLAFISKTNNPIETGVIPGSGMVDIGYFARELEDIFDLNRKESKKRKELCGKLLSIALAKRKMEDPSASTTVYGDVAHAAADVKHNPCLPKKGSEDHYKLMKWLGISDKAIAQGDVKPDFRAMSARLTERAEDGKELPPGITKTFAEYFCKFTRRKDTKGPTDG